MGAIPGVVPRGATGRRDLSYVPFSVPSWKWWCRRNGLDLVLLEHPVPGPLADAPPPIQRWQAARDMLCRMPARSQVTVVDADTIVRWDSPNFFDLVAEEVGAVHAGTRRWLQKSLDAYSIFFPGVSLDWRRCFNSGLVVLSGRHVAILDRLLAFYAANRRVLEMMQAANDIGVDQTLLNYFVHTSGEPIKFLEPAFNVMRCCELPPHLIMRFEVKREGNLDQLSQALADAPEAFDFVDAGYVWHFTTTIATRAAAMRETWRRVQHHYSD